MAWVPNETACWEETIEKQVQPFGELLGHFVVNWKQGVKQILIGNYNTCNERSILPKTRGEIYNLSLLFHPQCDKPNLIEKIDAKSYCSILLGLGCFWNSLSIKSLDSMNDENYEIKKRLSKHLKTLLQKLVLSVDLLPIVLLLLVL